jgi:hypothetical protein
MPKYRLFIRIKFEDKMSTEKLDKQITNICFDFRYIYNDLFYNICNFCFNPIFY